MKSVLALAFLIVAGSIQAVALADAVPAARPITLNIGVVSDYRCRGISQSKIKPALQDDIDYVDGPFYVGTWASTIQWVKDAAVAYNRSNAGTAGFMPVSETGAPFEWGLYGGTKADLIKDTLSYDVGVLAYVYPGEKFHEIGLANPDTGEVYGALNDGVFTAKVSLSATPLFCTPKRQGSQYYEFSANVDLGTGFTLPPDVAYQNITGSVSNAADLSYSGYSLTLGKDFGSGFSASLQVVATDAKKADYQTSDDKFTGRTGVVAGVKYSL